MAGLRRSHRNSHHGCSQCKKRKVKIFWPDYDQCDERILSCTPCLKRGIKCDYQDAFTIESFSAVAATTAQSDPGSEQLVVQFDPRSAGAPLTSLKQRRRRRPAKSRVDGWRDNNQAQDLVSIPPRAIAMDHQIVHPDLRHSDIEILHNFFTVTSFTLAPRDSIERHMLKQIPLSAQSNDFVRHALLGVSALHLASLHPESERVKYYDSAIQYLSKGISEFRATVEKLNPENVNAVFVFSGLSVLSELALLHPAYGTYRREQYLVDRFIQVFQLIRNVSNLWQSLPMYFHSTVPLKPRIQDVLDKKIPPPKKRVKIRDDKVVRIRNSGLIPEISSMAQRLHDLNRATTTDRNEQDIYSKVIDLLYVTTYKVAIHPGAWTLALRFTNVTPEYTQLLEARKPLALVILGHYCVVLHHGLGQWWMKDWGRWILNSIFELLDDTWIAHLSWAMEVMEPNRPSPLLITEKQLRDLVKLMDK